MQPPRSTRTCTPFPYTTPYRSDAGAPQSLQMSAATKLAADVLGKGANICTLAALNRNFRLKPVKAQEFQFINSDFSGRPVQLYSLTRVLIERLAIALPGRIHGWNLFDFTTKIV